jgi:translation initiation factor 2 beta subunit (eIF-2beta)/eIF-5
MEQNGKFYLTRNEEKLFDDNYRYRILLPEFAKGNHKGTPITIFTNYEEFCDALEIDKNLLMRIIAGNLSCRTGILKGTNNHYLLGNYSREDIMQIISNYVQEYLICRVCDYPEVATKYKNRQLRHKCKACGSKYYLTENQNKEYDITAKFYKSLSN